VHQGGKSFAGVAALVRFSYYLNGYVEEFRRSLMRERLVQIESKSLKVKLRF
jgi:hypothetical protein